MSTATVSRLRGTGYDAINTPTKDAGQMGWRNQIQQGIGSGTDAALRGLSGLASGDEASFQQMSAPAWRDFNQAQGGIASRFSGMGSGARRSSGHQNAQSGAATDFAERLQGQRLKLQQSAWEQLLGMGSHLFDQNLFETSLIPKKRKGWESFVGGALPVVGGVAGGALTGWNPAGIAAGAKAGGLASTAFLGE